MLEREFSRESVNSLHKGCTLSAICAIQSLMTNCTNNATRFLAGHRERIAGEHAFQSHRHIEDTQPHIIMRRAYQRCTMQGGTLPHRIAAAVFKPMISMGGEVSSPSWAKCSNHRAATWQRFTLFSCETKGPYLRNSYHPLHNESEHRKLKSSFKCFTLFRFFLR